MRVGLCRTCSCVLSLVAAVRLLLALRSISMRMSTMAPALPVYAAHDDVRGEQLLCPYILS